MSEVDQSATIQTALKSGAKIIESAGRTNLAARNKSKTGNLKKSFSVKVNKKKAYALSGFRRPQGAHAHLVDRGTTKRYTKKGYYRGAVKGSMFWTSAVESAGPRALNAVMDAIYDALNNLSRKK